MIIKARIRLYLECFGCCLMIAGFFLFLMSSKIQRANMTNDHSKRTLSFDAPFIIGTKSSMILPINESSLRTESGNKNFINYTQEDQLRESHTKTPISSSIDAPLVSPRSLVLSTKRDYPSTTGDIPDIKSSLRSEMNRSISQRESFEIIKWTPDYFSNTLDNYDCLVTEHQPAVETALSTVLTVSTLAGFHQTQLIQLGSCCLFHMVLVSTNEQVNK